MSDNQKNQNYNQFIVKTMPHPTASKMRDQF